MIEANKKLVIPKSLIEAFERKDIRFLASYIFQNIKAAQNLTPTQVVLIRKIVFQESKRINISAYTRYGKTQCVAIAVALYILVHRNKKIKFIGPGLEQAGLIRDYMTELILDSREGILLKLADLDVKGSARIKVEASKNRMTFKNGCEYRVVTAHGKGFTAMGHGGDLIIMDEAAMVSREAYAKITRMLGDDPENSMLVELYNPWDRDTKAFDHSISPRYDRIQIDYKIGLKEGRITQAFVDEQKEDMTPLEFDVLYNSKFPDESEDSLHSLSKIEACEKLVFNLGAEIKEIMDDIIRLKNIIDTSKDAHELNISREAHAERLEELARYRLIISCDPADQGLDFTVITWGFSKDNMFYEPVGIYSEPKSESMDIVGKIMQRAKNFIGTKYPGEIKIDRIGIGSGPLSRLKERVNELNLENIKVIGCHYGEGSSFKRRITKYTPHHKRLEKPEFLNKKAENNFRLRDIIAAQQLALGSIKTHKHYHDLKNELLKMKWTLTSSEQKQIIDPDKSPDYNDGLVYFVWKGPPPFSFGFL